MSEPTPVRLAIVGADATTLALAKAAAEHPDFEFLCITDRDSAIDPQIAELQRAVVRSAMPRDDWEALLDPGYVDGVLVARGNDAERRCDQLRKFAQVALPVLMAHPVVHDSLLLYELDMIRRDTGAILIPVMPDRQHPLMRMLLADIHSGRLGTVQQCTIERPLIDRSKPSVLHQFERDVDLLRQVCGELNQVSAMAATHDDAAYGNLMVQLNGPEQRVARWTVLPPDPKTETPARLTILGTGRQVVLAMPAEDRAWAIDGIERSDADRACSWNREECILQQFVRAIRREPSDPAAADLLDAARAMELAGNIGRSLMRRRTIDLHFEEHSEEKTFKSTMAAGGCLLLMLAIVALPILGIVAKAGLPGIGVWPWLMAGALGLFVLLQLLTLGFRK